VPDADMQEHIGKKGPWPGDKHRERSRNSQVINDTVQSGRGIRLIKQERQHPEELDQDPHDDIDDHQVGKSGF